MLMIELAVVVVLVVLEAVFAARTDVRRQRRDELRGNVATLRKELADIEPQKEYARFIKAERQLNQAQEELEKVKMEKPAAWLGWWQLSAPFVVAAVAAAAGRGSALEVHWPALSPVWTLVCFILCAYRVTRLAVQGAISAVGRHQERAGPQ
jgi:hypothetical protein